MTFTIEEVRSKMESRVPSGYIRDNLMEALTSLALELSNSIMLSEFKTRDVEFLKSRQSYGCHYSIFSGFYVDFGAYVFFPDRCLNLPVTYEIYSHNNQRRFIDSIFKKFSNRKFDLEYSLPIYTFETVEELCRSKVERILSQTNELIIARMDEVKREAEFRRFKSDELKKKNRLSNKRSSKIVKNAAEIISKSSLSKLEAKTIMDLWELFRVHGHDIKNLQNVFLPKDGGPPITGKEMEEAINLVRMKSVIED